MVLLKATRRRSHLRAERPGLVLPADGLGGPGEVRGVHVLVLEQEGAVAEEDGLEAAGLGVSNGRGVQCGGTGTSDLFVMVKSGPNRRRHEPRALPLQKARHRISERLWCKVISVKLILLFISVKI